MIYGNENSQSLASNLVSLHVQRLDCHQKVPPNIRENVVPIGNRRWLPIEAPRETMLSALSKAQAFTFEPAFQVDAEAKLVAAALSRPYDPREKTVYAAVVNALGLLISRIAPDVPRGELPPIVVNYNFDPLTPFPHR